MLKLTFHYVKIDNHNNKSDIKVKTSNSETVANHKTFFLFASPNDLSNILLMHFTKALNHSVYCTRTEV
jgi:hypothetical protein